MNAARAWAQFLVGAFILVHETVATNTPSAGLVLVGALLVGTEGIGALIDRIMRGRQ